MEDLALDRGELEHAPLRRLELIEPGGQQRLDRRGHDHLAVRRLGTHRDHLLDEQRIPAGRAQDPVAQVAGISRPASRSSISSLGLRERTAAQPERTGQPGRGIEQLGAGEAEQQDRRVAREQAICSTRSRKRSSAHWMSSKTTTSGVPRRRAASSLRNAQPISSADALRVSVPRRLRMAPAARGSSSTEGAARHLDHRPVGDPLPVRQAAAAHDRRIVRGTERNSAASRDLPTPADADDGEQAAGALGDDPLPRLRQQTLLALAADERRVVAAGKRRSLRIERLQAERGSSAGLVLHVRALERRPRRRRARPGGTCVGRAGSRRARRPAGAACRSRRARRSRTRGRRRDRRRRPRPY